MAFKLCLLAVGIFIASSTAAPIMDTVPQGSTWYIWSDSTHCERPGDLEVIIRDTSDPKNVVDLKPEVLKTGEKRFKLKAPFSGSYVLRDTVVEQPYAPPEVKIQIFLPGSEKTAVATYEPGLPPRSLDEITWAPRDSLINQPALYPSENFLPGTPKQGKEESLETSFTPDWLFINWCTGQTKKTLESFRIKMAEEDPVEDSR